MVFHRTKRAIIIVDVNDEQDSRLLLLLLLILSNLRGLLLPFFTVIWLEIVDFRGKKKMLLFLAFLGQRAVMDPSAVKLTARARGARHSLVNSKLDQRHFQFASGEHESLDPFAKQFAPQLINMFDACGRKCHLAVRQEELGQVMSVWLVEWGGSSIQLKPLTRNCKLELIGSRFATSSSEQAEWSA